MSCSIRIRVNNLTESFHTRRDDCRAPAKALLGRVGLSSNVWMLHADSYGPFSEGPADLDKRRGERFDADDLVDVSDHQHFVAIRKGEL